MCGGIILLHASLKLIVVIEVAILALAFSIGWSVSVWAGINLNVPAVLMVAMIAHTLCIVLLVFVRASIDIHCLSLKLRSRLSWYYNPSNFFIENRQSDPGLKERETECFSA